MAAIALLGTLDTKGDEFDWLRHRILTNGSQVVIIDVGSFSNSRIADYTSDEVIRAAGESPSDIRTRYNPWRNDGCHGPWRIGYCIQAC